MECCEYLLEVPWGYVFVEKLEKYVDTPSNLELWVYFFEKKNNKKQKQKKNKNIFHKIQPCGEIRILIFFA